MKEFEHPIDYDLDAALPRLKTWGLVKENNQVCMHVCVVPTYAHAALLCSVHVLTDRLVCCGVRSCMRPTVVACLSPFQRAWCMSSTT